MSGDNPWDDYASTADSPGQAPAAAGPWDDYASTNHDEGRDPAGIETAMVKGAASPITKPLHMLRAVGDQALTAVTGGAASLADALTFKDPGSHSSWIHKPVTEEGQGLAGAESTALKPVGDAVSKGYDKVAGTGPLAQTIKERVPEAINAVSTAVPLMKGAGALTDLAATEHSLPNFGRTDPAPATAPGPLHAGAAQTNHDLTGLSPETAAEAQRIIDTRGPAALSSDALDRHRDAESLPQPAGVQPIRLRKSSVNGDSLQNSDEKNLRGGDDELGDMLRTSIDTNDEKLQSSLDEIRRRATPEIVGRNDIEHSQSAINAIKSEDNDAVMGIRQNYKDLADANGGDIPIDKESARNQARSQLKKEGLLKLAEKDPVISAQLDKLDDIDEPFKFEDFEYARTRLAEVQRGGGSESAAAHIVRQALEDMPLSADAAPLKAMADKARTSAKARFDRIDQNPAYAAVVDDNVKMTGPGKNANGVSTAGLHDLTKTSPLADKFMDNFFLGNTTNASRAYISRIKDVMGKNSDFAPAIEAATLNKLRDAAGLRGDDVATKGFRSDKYNEARYGIDKKADVLMSPDSIKETSKLGRVAGWENDSKKSNVINRSNTALTLMRHGAMPPTDPTILKELAAQGVDLGSNFALAHAPLVGGIAKTVGSHLFKASQAAKVDKAMAAARRSFGHDATKPGAGLEMEKPRATRASGGSIDSHEAMVERLMSNWHRARKDSNAATKPMLHIPDEAIIKALDVARAAT